jgi:hypothetical protein
MFLPFNGSLPSQIALGLRFGPPRMRSRGGSCLPFSSSGYLVPGSIQAIGLHFCLRPGPLRAWRFIVECDLIFRNPN